MMEKTNEIKKIIKEYPQYADALFRRGYLITTNKNLEIKEYPFCNKWNKFEIDNYKIYVHKDQDFYKYIDKASEIKACIIGHAYNPFDMKYEEEELLKDIINEYKKSKEDFFDKISELTGIHLIVIFDKNKIIAVQDCSGIKSCYFGEIENETYITSHVQLVADICNLEMDEYVRKLVKTKCYNIGNRYLPGNISTYKELKRLGPNTYLKYTNGDFKIERFYPIESHQEIKSEEEFNKSIDRISEIMHNNCILATKKWKKPAISLSGGMDSKTTLSVANGLYDKFLLYSFQSKDTEIVDSEAAHQICENMNQPHKIYKIESDNENVKDFEVLKKIINHNTAYMMNISDHEIRKYIFLFHLNDFDIELKSWISEITRVFIERKYGIIMPENLTERHFNIFQTRYFLHPFLMRNGDKLYREFMKETGIERKLYNYEHADLFYWEVRMGSWGTNVISSIDIGNKVTMPFNNRKLIEEFLKFPHDVRKKDLVHENVIKKMNMEIYNTNITIGNKYFQGYRIMMEKIYYRLRTIFYRSRKD